MNPNVSITQDELERDLETNRERLVVREQDHADAQTRKSFLEETLKKYGKGRVWINETTGELTTASRALAEKGVSEIIAGVLDIAPGAAELHQIISKKHYLAIVNQQLIEIDEVAARDEWLVANVDVTTAFADIEQLTADIHRLEVLKAAAGVGALEGGVELTKGVKSAALAARAFQAVTTREQAVAALQSYREIQEARRGKSTGAIQWTNPA